MIFVPNQLVGAPTGTNVTIDCHTEAYPRAMSYWFLGDEMILSTDKYTTNIMENSYRAHMRLTIRNLTASDFGSYRCISKNSLGETEGSIRLYRKPTRCILQPVRAYKQMLLASLCFFFRPTPPLPYPSNDRCYRCASVRGYHDADAPAPRIIQGPVPGSLSRESPF